MSGLYIHVPFCPSVCPFCGFAVCVDEADARKCYLRFLTSEAQLAQAEWGESLGLVESIYVGGGTPSCLTAPEAELLLLAVRDNFKVAKNVELTWEVNPEHAKSAYLANLADMGVNRISLGVQSFNDHSLRVLGRKHTAEQAEQAVMAVAHQFANYNLDFILGAPHPEGIEAFHSSLLQGIAFQPPHVSVYALELEPNTPFGRSSRIQKWHGYQQDNHAKTMLWAAKMLQQHGWQQYEVSNFAQAGKQSRQNLLVWQGGYYLGLGPSAHSHLKQQRWANHRNLQDWQTAISKQQLPLTLQEDLTPQQRANEALMLALRQPRGLDINHWQQQFQLTWNAQQQKTCQQWITLRLATQHQHTLALTPKGLLLADLLTTQLML